MGAIVSLLSSIIGTYPELYGFGFAAVVIVMYREVSRKDGEEEIKTAGPWMPLVGNALAYKTDPDGLLVEQAQKLHHVFKLHLGFKERVVLSSDVLMKQFALASDTVLSSEKALASYGYRITLGDLNIYRAPKFHKQLIQDHFTSNKSLVKHTDTLLTLIEKNIQNELKQTKDLTTFDFLAFMQRTILTAMIQGLVSKKLIDYYNQLDAEPSPNAKVGAPLAKRNFVWEFMVFHDNVETASASVSTLPMGVAKPLYLSKVENKRLYIVKGLTDVIEGIWQDVDDGTLEKDDEGIWLQKLRGGVDEKTAEKVKDANEEDAAWLKAAEAADAIVGLLFAAYKNTSIAICQSVLCTLESSKAESISSKARTEAVKYFQDVSKRCSAMEALSQCDVIEKISLETLRLTAPAMGDVKQVVDPDGWKIPVDAGSTSDDAWMDSPEKDGKSTKKVKKSSAGDGKADKQAERFFRVPEGLFVAVSPIVSHRDTAKWGPNASEFDPFRSNPGVVAAYSNQSLHVNFSHGIYTTIGPEIPMMMMKLALVVLFGKYDLKLPAGHTVPPLSFTQDTFAQRKGKCFLSIVPKST